MQFGCSGKSAMGDRTFQKPDRYPLCKMCRKNGKGCRKADMSKIAILDTAISPGRLHCQKFHACNICREEGVGEHLETSHGTICARILDSFTSGYELYSIQIMKSARSKTEKPMGDVRHFKEGLLLCLELGVDIICMSAVSSLLSDSGVLYEITRKLAQKSILVAALDNRRYVTVPTAYPFVTGVQSDEKNCLHPGELAYDETDLFCAGLYANCDTTLLAELGCAPSNSFAVPAAAARMHDWINEGKQVGEELLRLRPYPAREIGEEISFKRGLGLYRELPLAVLVSAEEKEAYLACRAAMDALYAKYQVQSAALCSMDAGTDVRFRKRGFAGNWKQEILFMECCYKADLVFLVVSKEEQKFAMEQVSADLKAEICNDHVRISFENGCQTGRAEDLADMMYQILQ